MQFSIIIPMDFHRSRALDCIRGWVETQRMPADDFELICVLPSDDPDNELKVPRDAITFAEHQIVITLDRTTLGTVRLAWICPLLTGRAEQRRLDLPILRIAVEDC